MRRRAGLALIAGAVAAAALGRGAASDGAAAASSARFLGRAGLRGKGYGGFSAIHVFPGGQFPGGQFPGGQFPGGQWFLALSDRGFFVGGRFVRGADGVLQAVEPGPAEPLRGRGEGPLAPGRQDAEGIAVGPDGAVHVSFEGRGVARVLRYGRIDGPAGNLPSPPAFAALQPNSALEALASAPDGTLYTLPERSGAADRAFPVWRFRGGVWDQPFALPRTGDFLAVGADVGPDGRFYLLERAFRGLAGFATRLRRFRLGQEGPGAGETLLETRPGTHDNLEGLSVWQGPRGLVATMVSDDNFRWFLRSEIVEYALPA
jgi:hypothetical protein